MLMKLTNEYLLICFRYIYIKTMGWIPWKHKLKRKKVLNFQFRKLCFITEEK